MSAHTSITYGLPIRTLPLVPAINAWPRLEQPLLFLKLAALRTRRGTLVATKPGSMEPSAIVKVPIEVWRQIEHELCGIEVDEAHAQFLEDYCSGHFGCPCCWVPGKPKPNTCRDMCPSSRGAAPAAGTGSTVCSTTSAASGMPGERRLLEAFGLQLVTKALIKSDDSFYMDIGSATLIGLRDPHQINLRAEVSYDDADDGHAFATIPSTVPGNARLRFLTLVKQMRLEPLRIVDTSREKKAFAALPKEEQDKTKERP